MRDYVAEVGQLLDKSAPGHPLVSAKDLDALELRKDVQAELQNPALDKNTRLELEGMLQETERHLDTALERATADQGSFLRRAGILAQGVAKTVPSAWAGAVDLGDIALSKVTGSPEGASATEWLNSKLPLRPVNPNEEGMDTLGSILGGGATNVATRAGPGVIKAFAQGVATELGGRAGAGVAGELTDNSPVAQLLGALAGGGLTQVATSSPATIRRSLAQEATERMTPNDVGAIRAAQARARADDGIELTPGQVSGDARLSGLRNIENFAAQNKNSRVRAMQQPQEDLALLRARGIQEDLPGQVGTREALGRQGQNLAAAEINRVTRAAQQAYRHALNANGGRLTPESVKALDGYLVDIMQDQRRAHVPGMAETVQELRRSLYRNVTVERPELVPGRTEVDALTGQATELSPPSVQNVRAAERQPLESIEELRGIQDRAQPSFKDGGLGNLNPTNRKQQAMVRASTDRAITQSVPEVAAAKQAMQEVFQQENFGLKKSANALGGWVPKKGVTDEAASPEAMLTKLMDRGIEPSVPKTQSPPIRFARQVGPNPQAAEFFGNIVKTKLSETFSKTSVSGTEAGEGFSLKTFRELSSPTKARARADMVEAWMLASGRPESEGRLVSRGLDNFLETLQMISRKAPSSRKMPALSVGATSEDLLLEGAAASQYAPRAAHFSQKYLRGVLANSGQRWIDEQLTTPGGLEFLMRYARQNPKTDAARGMVLGALGLNADANNDSKQ